MIMYVNYLYIQGVYPVYTTSSAYTNEILSYKLRPIVFLSPDVKLKATSTAKQWEVVQ